MLLANKRATCTISYAENCTWTSRLPLLDRIDHRFVHLACYSGPPATRHPVENQDLSANDTPIYKRHVGCVGREEIGYNGL